LLNLVHIQSFLSNLKRQKLGLFEERRPNKKNKKKNKMSSDMGSVPDPEIQLTEQVISLHTALHKATD